MEAYVIHRYISLAIYTFCAIFVTHRNHIIISTSKMKFDPTQPFDLPLLPPDVNFKHEQFIDILLQTRTELGELNGYSYSLPNPLLLLSPAVIKESVASSNIENINTTMENALQASCFLKRSKRNPTRKFSAIETRSSGGSRT